MIFRDSKTESWGKKLSVLGRLLACQKKLTTYFDKTTEILSCLKLINGWLKRRKWVDIPGLIKAWLFWYWTTISLFTMYVCILYFREYDIIYKSKIFISILWGFLLPGYGHYTRNLLLKNLFFWKKILVEKKIIRMLC